jgi:hypothetical protein
MNGDTNIQSTVYIILKIAASDKGKEKISKENGTEKTWSRAGGCHFCYRPH